jgi:hypothetical protein
MVYEETKPRTQRISRIIAIVISIEAALLSVMSWRGATRSGVNLFTIGRNISGDRVR